MSKSNNLVRIIHEVHNLFSDYKQADSALVWSTLEAVMFICMDWETNTHGKTFMNPKKQMNVIKAEDISENVILSTKIGTA